LLLNFKRDNFLNIMLKILNIYLGKTILKLFDFIPTWWSLSRESDMKTTFLLYFSSKNLAAKKINN